MSAKILLMSYSAFNDTLNSKLSMNAGVRRFSA